MHVDRHPQQKIRGKFGPNMDVRMFHRRPAIAALLAGTVLAAPYSYAQAPAELQDTTLPASGRQSTLLNVSEPGRYALLASGPQGTSLQLVDRMSGPGEVTGIPGKEDGRLDDFLDRGEYKLIAESHPQGQGEAKISVRAFAEQNPNDSPRIVEHRLISSSLADFERRSYWLPIAKRGRVAIEAAGRSLADLRLWRDGRWLVDAAPVMTQEEPRSGQPLSVRRIVTILEPGLYRLSAYGGPPLAWASGGDEQPFHLRLGIPRLPVAGRGRHVASPFGVDRWRISAIANVFRLELPAAANASLRVGDYRPGQPFAEEGQNEGKVASLEKRSREPAVDIALSAGEVRKGERLITVRRRAGEPYRLQHFNHRPRYRLGRPGEFWISTLRAGHGDDPVDATAVVTEMKKSGGREKVYATRAVAIGPDSGYRRRFNLHAPVTLHLAVQEAGAYTIGGEGARAQFRVEPFLTSPPRGYRPPDFEPPGHQWHLESGLHVLSIEPLKSGGVLTMTIAFGGSAPPSESTATRSSARFAPLTLRRNFVYHVYANNPGDTKSGLVLRRLPLDPGIPLALSMHAGDTVEVEVQVKEPGEVRVVAEDGEPLEIASADGKWQQNLQLEPGRHALRVRNPATQSRHAQLALQYQRLSADASLPLLTPDDRLEPPDFPELSDGPTHFFDLEERERSTFAVNVGEPALYRLESTGLLATRGVLRTGTSPRLLGNAANGIGRNFLLQSYLRRGNYQLTVEPVGRSQGHLGLRLAAARLRDGGKLALGAPVRATLAAPEGLAYDIDIATEGRYRLRALGLNQPFPMRLEDGDGWPLLPPGTAADTVQTLRPGRYRLLVLPQAVDARVVTLVEAVPEPQRFEGHGPHPYPLAAGVIEHRWMEPAEGRERVPDQWTFELPASADATVLLDNAMGGTLYRLAVAAAPQQLAEIPALGDWQGRLAAGRYRIDASSVRRNNRVDYALKVSLAQLVTGQRRRLEAPSEVEVSVAGERWVEIGSFGSQDVRAALYDAAGQLVVENDDRPNDWNFQLATRLDEGIYQLRIQPVGQASAETEVSMTAPQERQEAPLQLPAEVTMRGRAQHVYPIEGVSNDVLLVARVLSDSKAGGRVAGLALEGEREGRWQTLGSDHSSSPYVAYMPGPADTGYRLRVWSSDGEDSLTLQIRQHNATLHAEHALGDLGLRLRREPGSEFSISEVLLEGPGILRLDAAPARLRLAGSPGSALAPPQTAEVPVFGDRLWLIASGTEATTVRARRVILDGGGTLKLIAGPDKPVAVDLAPSGGPSLVIAQSPGGQPGIAIGDTGSADALMAVAPGAAATVALGPGQRRARIWNASDTGALPVSLVHHDFSPAAELALPSGLNDVELAPAIARRWSLPSGTKLLRLGLPPETAAVLSRDGRVLQTLWSAQESSTEVIQTGAARLWLLSAAEVSQRATVEVSADTATRAMLGPAQVFSRYLPNAGKLRIAVAPGAAPARLRWHGAVLDTLWTGEDGRVEHDPTHELSASGTLTLRHSAGLVMAWLESDNVADWAEFLPNAVDVVTPDQYPLAGATARFRVAATPGAMLRIRADTPALIRVSAAGEASEFRPFPRGVDFHLPALAPQYTLDIISIVNTHLSGILRVDDRAGILVGEGLGPTQRLDPGDARLFTFEVAEKGNVGVGVRAVPDLVQASLMDAGGKVLGHGVVQMHELTPGRYLLAVEAPADGVPVSIRPAVVGLERPGRGAPEEVLRRYVSPDRELRQ